MGIDQKVMAAVQQNMNIASSPKAAIEMARSQGYKISKADEFEILASLNGGANWGKVGDEVDFSKTKAFEKATQAHLKEDSAKNPSKYEEKRFDLQSGRYIVYQKDAKTGKDSYKYYAANGKQLKEAYFKKQESLASVAYDADKNTLALKPKEEGAFTDYQILRMGIQRYSYDGTGSIHLLSL